MIDHRKYNKEFRKLDIIVVVPLDEDGRELVDGLQQLGANVRHLWPVPMPLPSAGDILICEFSADLAECTPWLPGEAPLPFMLHVPRNIPADFKNIQNCAPHGLLFSPCPETYLASTVLLAKDQYQYEQRMKSRICKLDENLRSMRAVEQAKKILMDRKQIGEEDAYRVLRRTAMERRITLGSIASAIVDSHELLG